MDYHTAYLKADAVARNLDLEKFHKEVAAEESSDSESSNDEAKNISSSSTDTCNYFF